MARRLAEEGCQVAAWNRSSSKAAALSEAGISVHQSAEDAIRVSDILVLMLSDASAIQAVLLSSDKPVDLQNKVVIQMGTIGDLILLCMATGNLLRWHRPDLRAVGACVTMNVAVSSSCCYADVAGIGPKNTS